MNSKPSNMSEEEIEMTLQFHKDKISMLGDMVLDLIKRVERLETK